MPHPVLVRIVCAAIGIACLFPVGIGCVIPTHSVTDSPPMLGQGAVSALWYGADGDTLYTVGTSVLRGEGLPRVRQWDVQTSRLRTEVGGFERSPKAAGVGLVATSSSTGAVATFYCEVIPTPGAPEWRGSLTVWTNEGKSATELPTGFDSNVTKLAFSPDGDLLAVAGGDKHCAVEVFDVKQQANIATLRHIRQRAFNGFDAGKATSVSQVHFSPDGKLLATGGSDGCICLWSVPKFEQLARLAGHADRLGDHVADSITGVVFSADGKTLLSAAWDGKVVVWDVESRKTTRTIQVRPPLSTNELNTSKLPVLITISPDSTRFATAATDRVALWDLASGKLLCEDRRTLFLKCLVFSPDGQELIASNSTPGLIHWEIQNNPGKYQLKVRLKGTKSPNVDR